MVCTRSERMAKWNEALRMEAELGAGARFAGRDALHAVVGVAMATARE